jgi:putative hydrolase of the HAD superfamily
LGREKEKPSIAAYKLALKKIKSRPEETAFIGDNPLRDFSGAKKLNIKTIRILRGEYKDIKTTKDIDFTIKKYDKNFIKLIKNIK